MSVSKAEEDLQRAELDALPQSTHNNGEKHSMEAERSTSSRSGSSLGSSLGSSSGLSSSVDYDPQARRLQSRNTEVDLERQRSASSHALSRIETQRLQHAMTVGESVRPRASKLPLPAFGAGKPYPPPLPNREDYVVEFEEHDDPLYPQNWPLKRKYVASSPRQSQSITDSLCSESTLALSSHSQVSAQPSIPPSSALLPPVSPAISVSDSKLQLCPVPCILLATHLDPWSGRLFPS